MNKITFASIAAAVWVAIIFPVTVGEIGGVDLKVFMAAAEGDLTDFYYAPWSLHFFEAMIGLPMHAQMTIIGIVNIVGLSVAAWVFGGSIPVVVTSYAIGASLFFGQPDGIWAFGLAMAAIGLKKKNPLLTGGGLFLALAKFYIGLPLGVGVLWCFGDRKTVLRSVTVTGILLFASLVVYGPWPLEILWRMGAKAPNNEYAIDLWRYTGPAILMLWAFTLTKKSYRLWVATWMMTTPYIHMHGATHMLAVAGPIGLLGNISYITGFGHQLVILQIVPMYLYGSALLQWLSVSLSSESWAFLRRSVRSRQVL
jgi:hypothetical protein